MCCLYFIDELTVEKASDKTVVKRCAGTGGKCDTYAVCTSNIKLNSTIILVFSRPPPHVNNEHSLRANKRELPQTSEVKVHPYNLTSELFNHKVEDLQKES